MIMKKLLLFILLIPALCFGQMNRFASLFDEADQAFSVMSQPQSGMKRETLSYNGIPYLKYSPTTMKVQGSILFLHGIGERGTDLTLVERNEIPKMMLTTEVPYIVIAPQLPSNQGGWWEFITNPMVDLMKTMPGHKHLTGLSLGAMRVTVILAERPNVFDSYSTVCGTNDVPTMGASFVSVLAGEIKRIPGINYYDPLDKTIGGGGGYSSIKAMCDQFAGKADITYRDINLPGPDHHAIWPIAYQQGNFWTWLNSKVSPPPAPVLDPVVSTTTDGVNIYFTTASGKTIVK